jgi:hypothetical protein
MKPKIQISQEEIDAALANFLAKGGSVTSLAPQNAGSLPLKVNYSNAIEAGIEQMAGTSQLQEISLPSKTSLK